MILGNVWFRKRKAQLICQGDIFVSCLFCGWSGHICILCIRLKWRNVLPCAHKFPSTEDLCMRGRRGVGALSMLLYRISLWTCWPHPKWSFRGKSNADGRPKLTKGISKVHREPRQLLRSARCCYRSASPQWQKTRATATSSERQGELLSQTLPLSGILLTVAGHCGAWDNVMGLYLIEDEEAKMAKAWELWERCCLFGKAQTLTAIVYMRSFFYYPSALVLIFLLTKRRVSDWPDRSLQLQAWVRKARI